MVDVLSNKDNRRGNLATDAILGRDFASSVTIPSIRPESRTCELTQKPLDSAKAKATKAAGFSGSNPFSSLFSGEILQSLVCPKLQQRAGHSKGLGSLRCIKGITSYSRQYG